MKRTRILSLILALCMIFSLFSTPVLASDSSSSVSAQSSEDEEESKKAEEEKKKEEEEKKKAEEEKKKKEEEEKKKAEEEKKKKEEEEQKKAEEEKKKKEEEEKKKAEEEEQKKKEEEEKKKEESDKSDSSSDKSSKSDSSADKSDKSDSSADKSDKSDSSADKSDRSDSSADKSSKSDSSADKSSKSDSSADKSSKSDSSAEAESDASGSQSAEASSSQQAEGELSTQDGEQDVPQETPQVVEEQPEEQKQEEQKQDEEIKDNDTKVHAKLISDQADAQTLTAASFSDYSNSTGKAAGASVSFTRLITLEVTDLVPDNSSEGKKNLSRIESVMSWINRQNDKAEYAGAMFKVIIPKGKYYINCDGSCIHLYSNTWLSMNGVTLVKSVYKSGAIIRAGAAKSNGKPVNINGYNGQSNIIVEGGVIDANTKIHPKDYHFSGVRFGHDHDILIANTHFKGSVSGHHLELCGVKNISVVGCTFSDYKDTGYTKGINRNEAIQIDVTNNDNLCPTYGYYDDTVTGNVVVYKNQFVDLSRGVGSHSAVYGKYYDNVVIQGNSFMNIKSQAVHCENYRNCAIVDNIITNCGGGIDFNAICFAPDGNYYEPHGSLPSYGSISTYDAGTVISANQITIKKSSSLSNASGIYVHGGKATSSRVPKAYRKKTFRITGVSVDGNVITRSRSAGIYLACVDGYSVANNQITKVVSGSAARGMGIYLDSCGGGNLLGNTISGTKSHGIYLISSKGSVSAPITVHGNRVNATAKTGCIGVYLKSSRYVDLTSNTVNAKSYAVYLSKASNVNIGERNAANDLTSSSKYGIYATGKSKKGIYAQHNKITAKKKAVYAAKGSKIKSSNNATVVASSRKKSK